MKYVDLTRIGFVWITGGPQPVAVNVTVAMPANDELQVTSPLVLTVFDALGLSSGIVHTVDVALEMVEVNCVDPDPSQRDGNPPMQMSQPRGVAATLGLTVIVFDCVTGAAQPVTVNVIVAWPVNVEVHVTCPDELMVFETSGLSSDMVHDGVPLATVEVNWVVPPPTHRDGGVPAQISQANAVAEGKGVTVIVVVFVISAQPVTVSVITACPEKAGLQVTNPVELIVLRPAGEILHVGVPTIVEVSCVVPGPWHRVGGVAPQISQVGCVADVGVVTVIIFVFVMGEPQLATVSVIHASPVKAGSHETNPVGLIVFAPGLPDQMVHVGVPAIVDVNWVVPPLWHRVAAVQTSQPRSVADADGYTVSVFVTEAGEPQPETNNSMVTRPVKDGFQLTIPVGLMVLETSGLSSQIFHEGVPPS
jgi:hypothetical protein